MGGGGGRDWGLLPDYFYSAPAWGRRRGGGEEEGGNSCIFLTVQKCSSMTTSTIIRELYSCNIRSKRLERKKTKRFDPKTKLFDTNIRATWPNFKSFYLKIMFCPNMATRMILGGGGGGGLQPQPPPPPRTPMTTISVYKGGGQQVKFRKTTQIDLLLKMSDCLCSRIRIIIINHACIAHITFREKSLCALRMKNTEGSKVKMGQVSKQWQIKIKLTQ